MRKLVNDTGLIVRQYNLRNPGSVAGFALIAARVLTFLFTGRDAAITMNGVKNRHHAVMSF